MELQFLVYCLYGIPSLILNFMVIICICKSKTLLKSSFYRVYLFVLLVYLATYINTYPTVKLPELSVLAKIYAGIEGYFPPFRVCYMFQLGAFHIQNCALILMHLNRWTSVWMPITYYQIWRPRNINIIGLLITLIGNGICYQNLIVTENIFVVAPNGYATSNPAVQAQTDFTWSTVMAMGHVYPFISLAINALIFVKLILLRGTGSSFSSSKTIEFNLFLICIWSLLMQLGLMLFIDHAFDLFQDFSTIAFVLNLVSDFSTLSEAYVGLFLNQTLRSKMIRMLVKSSHFADNEGLLFRVSSRRAEPSLQLKITKF